jgi:hypothetical protein
MYPQKDIFIQEAKSKTFAKGTKHIIIDSDNKKYQFWELKADGSATKAYDTFLGLGIKPEMWVNVTYAENQKEWQGRSYTERTILAFSLTNRTGTQSTNPQQTPRSESPSASNEKSEEFWDKKAYKQCLWGYFIANGSKMLSQGDMDLVWAVFTSIEKDAENRFSPSKFRQAVQKAAPQVVGDLPTIEQDEPPIETYADLAEQVPF